MTADARERLIGVGCGLVVIAVWSNFIVLSRLGAVGALNAFDLAALRFGVSGVIMLPVLYRLGFGGLGPGRITLITLTAGLLFGLFAYTGFTFAPAQHGAVLLPGTPPLFTAVLAWAVFTIASRAWRVSPPRGTAIVAVFSMAAYLPVHALFLPSNPLAASPGEVVFQGVSQGVFAVIVSLFAFTRAVAALGPAVTTMITAAVPGTAALWAVPVLGEPLSAAAGIGLALVTLGMLGAVLSVAPPRWSTARPAGFRSPDRRAR